MNTATIADFVNENGVRAIVRRHATYNKPSLPVDNNTMCALIYSRAIDSNLLGLNAEGSAMMFRQGELLAEMGVRPAKIITGIDLRNYEGGLQTAAGVKKICDYPLSVLRSPAVTYPYYDATKVVPAWEQFGDFAAHAYLADSPELQGLWTETADVFDDRIHSAINNIGRFHLSGPVLFDLNFEQLVLLHYMDVKGFARKHIPYDPSAWVPKNGGGIIYAPNGVVAEFNPDFTLV
ncbi:MAG: hypothetical protein HY918_04890 [Candidatus Doudnabacteria bacterium]|nr:hypothetical protein [Candidatus Doudnabacteria bacterium]